MLGDVLENTDGDVVDGLKMFAIGVMVDVSLVDMKFGADDGVGSTVD